MENLILSIFVFLLVLISFYKDRKKTKMAVIKAWKSFVNILPQLLGIVILVGIILSIIDPSMISKILGKSSGWFGVIVSAVVGSITIIPGFVAFPTAAILIENGSGYMQIGAFISTLMMVGVMTYPVEVKYFGKKTTIQRNMLCFLFSFIVAFVIGKVVG